MKKSAGSLALLGGGEWTEPAGRSTVTCCTSRSPTRWWWCRPRRRSSTPIGRSSGRRPGSRGSAPRPPGSWCSTGATPRTTPTSRRSGRAFVYLSDGSPLHLRSVLKESRCSRARRATATARCSRRRARARRCSCDPMVDPRGGATRSGSASSRPRDLPVPRRRGRPSPRALDRAPPADAVLVGVDEHTAIVREASGQWNVIGPGHATVYRGRAPSATVSRRRTVDPRRGRRAELSRLRDRHLVRCRAAASADRRRVDGRATRSSARRRCPS